jgi:hypothetical protein
MPYNEADQYVHYKFDVVQARSDERRSPRTVPPARQLSVSCWPTRNVVPVTRAGI